MCIDGDVLELDIEMDLEEVKALRDFVKDRMDYIEEISLLCSRDGLPVTSSLFTLLFAMKKVKPSLKIAFMETMNFDLEKYGIMHWVNHE